MKKIVLALTAVLFLAAGCAHNKVVQAPDQSQMQPAAQQESAQKVGPAVQAPSHDTLAESDLAKEKQAKAGQSLAELPANMQNVYFEYDRSDIKAEGRSVLAELAATLGKKTASKVVIEGHCDERGTSEYNLALGDKRANAAKMYLMSLGVVPGRLQTISYGKEKPVCTESTEACRAKNRRAHFNVAE